MKFAAESVHGKFRRDAIFWGKIREIASRPLLLLSATMPSKSHNNGHVGGWCGVCVGGGRQNWRQAPSFARSKIIG